MKCDDATCNAQAYANYQWQGGGAAQEANLCSEHAAQLWRLLGPLCAIGKASFTNCEVKNDRRKHTSSCLLSR